MISAVNFPDFSQFLFDHPVEIFRVVETHISWVLLTGPFAYKIKKPVNLGFLDFTSLEGRRRFCEEEVRINRRLAPDLYLGVVRITGSPASPKLNGSGEAFEYAVKMVQFPERDRLDRRLGDGRLTDAEIDGLARLVADFHESISARAGTESPFGRPENIRKTVDDCLSSLKSDPGLKSWCDVEFARLEPVFLSRREKGCVREGHGDLHLANIVFYGGRAVPFDALEFSEDLRWIDVMNDVAFTVMDLEERGAARLGRRFLNGYLETTGDYEGLRVFRYYLVYRALVRALVAGIRAEQGAPSAGEKTAYLELASRLTRPIHPPRLWITHGLSGSGKTYGTQKWIEGTGAIRLRTDVERRRTLGSVYTPEASALVYGRLIELAALLIKEGYPVVVDGVFLRRSERDAFRKIARTLNIPFSILAFDAPDSVLKERLTARKTDGRDASEADWTVVENQKRWLEPLGPDELALVDRDSPNLA